MVRGERARRTRARGATAGKVLWGPGRGCGPGVSGIARALCGDPGGTRAPRRAGRSRATSAGDAAGLPARDQPPASPAPGTSPESHGAQGTATASGPFALTPALSRSILSVLLSAPLLLSFTSAVPHLVADFAPTLAPRTPFLPSRVAPHYSHLSLQGEGF